MHNLIERCAVLCALILTAFSVRFSSVYKPIKQVADTGDPGKPLMLTPLIRAGKIKEAQEAAQVTGDIFLNVKSYSGYLTVDEAHKSNLFFWFFPSRTKPRTAPVLLWLQGGPGSTSLFGLFAEHGPFYVTRDLNLTLRKYAWTKNHSVIYVDNPVGTGYSFTDASGYCRNQTIIGAHLYAALLQFFQLFPDLQKNEFFVTGESYAGKYVPAVSYTIHKNNPSATQKINLQGLAIGNGFSDPEHQLMYGEYLYEIGLIDANVKEMSIHMEEVLRSLIKKKHWTIAFKLFDEIMNGDFNNHPSLFKNTTGFDNYFNYLFEKNTNADYFGKFIQQGSIRAAIHVGNATFNSANKDVEMHLIEDIMQSVAPWVSELLNNYRVLIYNGQLDIIVAYPLTVNYLKNLKFSAAKEYRVEARREFWYVGKELAGYVKQAGNLTEVMVRNAGHMVPVDQPLWAWDLITRFTHKNKFV